MEPTQQKQFTFSPEGAKKMMNAQYVARLPLMIIAVFVGGYIGIGENSHDLLVYPLLLVMLVILVGGSLFLGYKLGMKRGIKNALLETFTITETSVERKSATGNKTNIEFSQITKHQTSKFGLLIQSGRKRLLIPSFIDGYDELSALILKHSP